MFALAKYRTMCIAPFGELLGFGEICCLADFSVKYPSNPDDLGELIKFVVVRFVYYFSMIVWLVKLKFS